MAKNEAPETPALIRVWPSEALLARGEYLPGVGSDGAEISPELAEEWLAAGLVTTQAPSED